MPLLSVWQLDLNSGGPVLSFGTATSVPAKQQAAPQRAVTEYVIGRGFFTPDMATTATQPLLGKIGEVPQYPYVFAVDQVEAELTPVSAMAAGTSQTITTLLSFNLPKISLDPTDNATLLLLPDVWLDPVVSGLIIASVELAPQALTASVSNWIDARTLQGGQTYTAWRMNVTVGLVAVTASAATNLHVGAQALVTVLPQ